MASLVAALGGVLSGLEYLVVAGTAVGLAGVGSFVHGMTVTTNAMLEHDFARGTPKPVADVRHELITLARAGMTPVQIAGQLQCSEKNVYTMLAEAIGKQQLSLEQALDLPEDLMGEVQDAFLDGEGAQPLPAGLDVAVRGAELEITVRAGACLKTSAVTTPTGSSPGIRATRSAKGRLRSPAYLP